MDTPSHHSRGQWSNSQARISSSRCVIKYLVSCGISWGYFFFTPHMIIYITEMWKNTKNPNCSLFTSGEDGERKGGLKIERYVYFYFFISFVQKGKKKDVYAKKPRSCFWLQFDDFFFRYIINLHIIQMSSKMRRKVILYLEVFYSFVRNVRQR